MVQDRLDACVQALEAISPMPDDDAPQMTAEMVDRYVELVDAIARELEHRFDVRAIRALVQSFGLGDGFETYWSTVHVIERFRDHEATYALIRAGVGDDVAPACASGAASCSGGGATHAICPWSSRAWATPRSVWSLRRSTVSAWWRRPISSLRPSLPSRRWSPTHGQP